MKIIDLERFDSVNAEHAKETLSQKYDFIPTMRAVEVMKDNGWFPVRVQERNTRIEENRGFQKHMIRFRQTEPASMIPHETIIPELVMTNSHDGLSSFVFQAGLFRLVCSNGAVVATGTVNSIRVKHMGFQAEQVYQAIGEISRSFPLLTDKIERWRSINLSPEERIAFAESAAVIRFGEEKAKAINTPRLLNPTRREDASPDLFTTFNVLQEKLIRGGKYAFKDKHGFTAPDKAQGHFVTNGKVRGIGNISEDIRINTALWMLTEKMEALKG